MLLQLKLTTKPPEIKEGEEPKEFVPQTATVTIEGNKEIIEKVQRSIEWYANCEIS